ncbi:30S ribosome-binding factor RbfA [Kineosporia sp. R_H_3]|uniref:30S ribosome-binding factor RbfA n=1 Tax=Kineosporia sp. R_H_3 TaxID=1961848 RepID=UPI000B4A9723|nr:30S ribosome-binding factor RbfA [Kineosporia sp. R_H_3]
MADTARARKLADRIKVVVAETLEKRIKDPRLGFVTVTDARVTGDLQHASVFYTVYGDAAEQTASAAALESAKGVVRSEVGRRTGIRLTPTLEFIADAVPENAQHIDELLALAAARDAEVAALAAKAEYAGDPDPYKHDDLEEVDDALDAEDSAEDADDEDDEDWDTDEDDADEPSDGPAGAVASADGTVTGP